MTPPTSGTSARGRIARVALLGAAGLALAAAPAAAAEQDLSGIVSVRLLGTSGDRSWLRGGLGKLRFDGSDQPIDLGDVTLSYRARLGPLVTFHAVASSYGDGGRLVDLNEAYLELRPVPRSRWRLVSRLGAFHAPFSLENTSVGWTSPYTISSSAVNTWFGEELRTIGAEAQVTRLGAPVGSPSDLGAVVGIFRANDPAGALLSWRGWSLSDRQTRLLERLPLAALPAFESGGSYYPVQGAFEKPFHEIDGREGYYAGLQWDYLDRSRLRLQHYDNRGDATKTAHGQWAWRTEFNHLGWHLRLPHKNEMIAQVVDGETEMDRLVGPLVYANFRAAFLLLSHSWGHQRLSVRYDDFWVRDRDLTADDLNAETGHAWTAAWFVDRPRAGRAWWRFGVEALSVESWRPARRLIGERPQRTERSLQLTADWHL